MTFILIRKIRQKLKEKTFENKKFRISRMIHHHQKNGQLILSLVSLFRMEKYNVNKRNMICLSNIINYNQSICFYRICPILSNFILVSLVTSYKM